MLELQVPGNNGQELSNRIKLLCTLRYLAGGSHWDICFGFKVGFGSFFHDGPYGVVWPTLEAIDKAFIIGIDLENREEMQRLADEFAAIDSDAGVCVE